ncbi:MAG TPA: hypothetical protein DCE42_26490 [Myxococcales bacterium]|nr:hypothetical protein [Deltaproteobacteria bacterium]MBU54225.1 hypothetical protein [Deltaproteobacteria bacterium]HAA58339.1 hypothetical protein [Myxococcales bacterium]|tara:strand:+ start:2199 stop:2942 length:744 start_codon:yes stop_codon:yes gene_type:complete
MWLTSSILSQAGFSKHGFTTRKGGVSEGDFASWNFSTSTGDAAACVEKNYAILAEHMGVSLDALFTVHQVHSDEIVVVDEQTTSTSAIKADALLCLRADTLIGVKTADCVPVLMADPGSGVVAAIHAGWRGVVSRIVPKTLSLMREYVPNAKPVVVIGPHIREDAFQVGAEVAAQFPGYHKDDPSEEGKYLVDLVGVLREQLEASGSPYEGLDIVEGCTLTDPEHRFFSHRRSGGRCGRMFNFIMSR